MSIIVKECSGLLVLYRLHTDEIDYSVGEFESTFTLVCRQIVGKSIPRRFRSLSERWSWGCSYIACQLRGWGCWGCEGFLLHAADVVFEYAEEPIGLPAQSASGLEGLGRCGLLGCGDVSVEFSAAYHGEEDVEASACERDDWGVVSFAFFAFSFIELPGTLVESDRCKRRLP